MLQLLTHNFTEYGEKNYGRIVEARTRKETKQKLEDT